MKAKDTDSLEKPLRPRPPRVLQSDWIFEGEREVIIVHQRQEYRLRVTRADKLILTK